MAALHMGWASAGCAWSFWLLLLAAVGSISLSGAQDLPPLRFNSEGTFKILQIADMHYGNGVKTPCRDLEAKELRTCSDRNTTLFVQRLLAAEKPDLVVFTGDNIDFDASNATGSMDEAFKPVIDAKIPWAAVLGNHDHESNLPREDVMKYLTKMDYSLSRVLNPSVEALLGQEASQTPIQVNGVGNYYLQVFGPAGSDSANTSLLNLYFLDTGEYSKFSRVGGYDWIRASQILWYQLLAAKLRGSAPEASTPTPALAYFHIPIPEYESVLKDSSMVLGDKHEAVLSPLLNSGFFTALLQAGDVRATFAGHDHTNDYCGELMGIHLCYGGGVGYHAYGKVGWPRRARVVGASLRSKKGVAKTTQEIVTWKRLDDSKMSKIDPQVLWDTNARRWTFGMKTGAVMSPLLLILLTLVITACSSCLFNTLYAKYRRKVGIDEYSRVTEDIPLESNYPIDSDNSDDD
ncbi:hypothetical protein M758_12G064700 [Ceratodon purpureus]|nr:hypothetical protein M758_12G064700 [Ceratodon purpureus]